VTRFGEAAARLSSAAAMLLGWRPDEFWSATPAELALALMPGGNDDTLDRSALDELQRRFPDDLKQEAGSPLPRG
jgi:uncharacterized phage protein (TIGR02216 family)